MTHVFALGELLGEPDCAAFADHGLDAIATAFADAEHGGWRTRAGVPGKAAYDHAFVLLAGASAALAGRPGGAALLEAAAGGDRRALLGRGRGRLPRGVGRRVARARALPRREREHAHGRGVPRRGRRDGRAALGGARPADRRAADRPRGAGARLARRGALQRRLGAAAGLQRRPPERPLPAVRPHARPRARVGAAAARPARGAPGPAGLAARGAAGAVRPRARRRLGRRLRLHDGRRREAGRARADALGPRRGDRRRRDARARPPATSATRATRRRSGPSRRRT